MVTFQTISLNRYIPDNCIYRKLSEFLV